VSITVVSTTQLNLSWTQNEESNLNHYNVYRGTNSGFSINPDTASPVGTPTTTAFADTGLIASTTYYYRVAAVDNEGNVGDLSSEQSGTTSGASDNG
jgi:Fibronectin type 3 domain-containing protein